jgi:hypothetical protein
MGQQLLAKYHLHGVSLCSAALRSGYRCVQLGLHVNRVTKDIEIKARTNANLIAKVMNI